VVAVPTALAAPVSPELAFPELAVVSFWLLEEADPVSPPVVVPVAVESPLAPEVADASDSVEAGPVLPVMAWPSAFDGAELDSGWWERWSCCHCPAWAVPAAVPAARRSAPPAMPARNSRERNFDVMGSPFEGAGRADLARRWMTAPAVDGRCGSRSGLALDLGAEHQAPGPETKQLEWDPSWGWLRRCGS
jgi:hypothetical protein